MSNRSASGCWKKLPRLYASAGPMARVFGERAGWAVASRRCEPGRQGKRKKCRWESAASFDYGATYEWTGARKLRAQLGGHRCALRRQSSSEEYLLAAWQKWGADGLEKVLGDFSCALWDDGAGTMWCARDFIGARSFYYAHAGAVFCFSNTLDVLRWVPEVSKELAKADAARVLGSVNV
jgi:hypothetical protein